MGLLERAIRRGVSDAVGKAIGGAVKQAVTPVAEKYANEAAKKIDETAANASQSVQAAKEQAQGAAQTADSAAKSGGFANLESAFGNLAQSLEGYATEAAKNLKTCPSCGETASADKKFCPSCGAKLPEQTLAEGAVCRSCGAQNAIGTKFCSECGTKLPAAEAEEQASAEKLNAVLAKWDELLPQYPKWSLGGESLDIEKLDEQYTELSAAYASDAAARSAFEQYQTVLREDGFREAGQYPDRYYLYKKVNGLCYMADFSHSFEGGSEIVNVYFAQKEPEGGFDYVKPAPQEKKGSGLFDILKKL